MSHIVGTPSVAQWGWRKERDSGFLIDGIVWPSAEIIRGRIVESSGLAYASTLHVDSSSFSSISAENGPSVCCPPISSPLYLN